jgi:broad specificity phosphatase PhoE
MQSGKVTIYLVRHEERYQHGLFDCSLTCGGICSAKYKLPNKIDITNPNIYCSPLLRTVQTIYPFAKKHNLKIRLEDSLYEFVNHQTSHYIDLPKVPKIENIVV